MFMPAFCGSVAFAQPEWEMDPDGFKQEVLPFFESHCLHCHGESEQEGGFRVDQIGMDFSKRHVAEQWHELLHRVQKGEMPPDDEPSPEPDLQAAATDWIAKQLQLAATRARSTGGQVVLRRMNRAEYNNTIRDLVGVDFQPAANFPEDPPAFGFDNVGSALSISPLHFEKYLAAAREIMDRAIVSGERPASSTWHMEVERAHPSNQFAGRKSAGDSELWHTDPHHPRHRYLIKGAGLRVEDEWLIKSGGRNDGTAGFRWFRIPQNGVYRIRVRAAGRIPNRNEIEDSALSIRWKRAEQALRKKKQSGQSKSGEQAGDTVDSSLNMADAKKEWMQKEWPRTAEHLAGTFYYRYGSPRMKLVDGKGIVFAEVSVENPVSDPEVYEFFHEFEASEGKNLATVTIENSYQVPAEVTNHGFVHDPHFARPELWIDWLEIDGPYFADWPIPSQQTLLFDSPNRDDEAHYAREVLERFMTRAFRRPVTSSELNGMLKLFEQAFHGQASGDQTRGQIPSFEEAIKLPMIATLCSPHFLYLAEPSDDQKQRQLTDYELASRLSYFLWSTMPDEELFELASKQLLSRPEILVGQVNRMLADPKSEALVKNFAGQWLGLRDVGANPPSRDLFPRYDDHLQESIVSESEAFFREILQNDLNIRNFITSDFVTINNRLSRFYEIDGVHGDHFRRVAIEPADHRGGLMTQASVLTVTSNGTRTSPVIRGKWILENLLGDPPPPPPPDAGDIQPKVPGIDKATVRVRLEHHREIAACAICHAKIDPLGFALENFAADGQWRTHEGFGYKGRVGDRDPQIDASGILPDGTQFRTFDDFRQLMLQREGDFRRCLTEKLMTYALGRGLEFSDDSELNRIATNLETQPTLRNLILDIVASELFNTK